MKQDIIDINKDKIISHYKVNYQKKTFTTYMIDRSNKVQRFVNQEHLEKLIRITEMQMEYQLKEFLNKESIEENFNRIKKKLMTKAIKITFLINSIASFSLIFIISNIFVIFLIPLLVFIRKIFLYKYEDSIEEDYKSELEKYEIFYNNKERFQKYEKSLEKKITINNIDNQKIQYLKQMREYIIDLQVEEVIKRKNELKQKCKEMR